MTSPAPATVTLPPGPDAPKFPETEFEGDVKSAASPPARARRGRSRQVVGNASRREVSKPPTVESRRAEFVMIGEDKLHRAITKINAKDEIIDDEGSRQLYAGTYRQH